MGKPAICICENKDADQLRGNREADQRLCFRYSDSTIPLLLKSEISSFKPASIAVQAGLCQTWSETTLLVFPRGGSSILVLVTGAPDWFSFTALQKRRHTDCRGLTSQSTIFQSCRDGHTDCTIKFKIPPLPRQQAEKKVQYKASQKYYNTHEEPDDYVALSQQGSHQTNNKSEKYNSEVYIVNGNHNVLFELMFYVPVNSNGRVGTLPPFYGTFTQHYLGCHDTQNVLHI